MSNAESDSGPGAERVWCRITLANIAGLIDGYELWKDGPWYHAVDWRRVSAAADDGLQRLCRNGTLSTADLNEQLLAPAERSWSQTDYEGLDSLFYGPPIEVTRRQLHNGGHRLSAMRQQGVEVTPGACMLSDVGAGIDTAAVYPVDEPPLGGRSSSVKPE